MYIAARQLSRLPVMSLQDEGTIGHITEAVIDPALLGVVAFRCESTEQGTQAVLLAADVRQLSDAYAVINSAEDLTEPEEIVRLKELLGSHYNPLGKLVVSDTGRKLGKVYDYSVDLETFRIQKLVVRPSLLSFGRFITSMIDRTQIIDVSPKQITVRDVTVHASLLSGETSPQGLS